MKALTAALATALGLTACAHGTTTATTTATATTPAPVRAPASPAPVPSVFATAKAARAPAAVGAKRAHSAGRHSAVAGPPQILGATVSPTVVGSGSVVNAVVHTTPGVVSVSAFAAGTSIPMPRVGSGIFAGSTTLPPLPPFARGSYPVTFVARDARGASTQSAVSVTVR